jgi:Tol biopolymer transport system component
MTVTKILVPIVLVLAVVLTLQLTGVFEAHQHNNTTRLTSSGGKIAFVRGGAIYIMNADGSNQTQLVNTSGDDNTSPSWSPDGSKIAFVSRRDGHEQIYVMNVDGSNRTLLTNNVASHSYRESNPSWSPDGSKIAVMYSSNYGDTGIYVMNADGSNPKLLTNSPLEGGYASWSPDGSKIAFHSFIDGSSRICVINSDGSNQTQLIHDSIWHVLPSWSPDGSKLAFFSASGVDYAIDVVNADGSDLRRLINNLSWDDAWWRLCSPPSWSPDGSKIAFCALASDSYRDYEVYVMNADGSNLTQLTSSTSANFRPAWCPRSEQSFQGAKLN